ncbi:aldose epimerase family protein [Winogradskyella flava]|uniref:aldose epimerase family protein n=1 Tax=Winogradskyella flava TaxID=1884876 RepID=UPI002490E2F9|nr:aldose epimerase family protein [Winogradskyella flava]
MQLIPKSNFTTILNDKSVSLFNLKNKQGLVGQITNYGGRLISLWTKDKNDKLEDIVLGYNSIQDYLDADEMFFGAIIGRYGNRIAAGQFTLDNNTYGLETNNTPNHLHGGLHGFHNVVWDANQISESKLELYYTSNDGEAGYPGNLKVTVIYELTQENALHISYSAKTDKKTIVNLTHHSYFNLQGAGSGTINNHLLQIYASHYTPVNTNMIPTGEIASVKNSPFDFTESKPIGKDLDSTNTQLQLGSGYDHNFVLDYRGLKKAAIVKETISGRKMTVYTTEPGIQFYGGNHLNTKKAGKNNLYYNSQTGFCLETQHFPNSPNQPNFPSTVLEPRDTYTSICIYKFGII